MQIWQDEDVFKQSQEGGCCGLSAVEDARRVAAVLDIPYYVMNFKADFKKYVIDYFVSEYERAYTPNPCICRLEAVLCGHNGLLLYSLLLSRASGEAATPISHNGCRQYTDLACMRAHILTRNSL